MTASELTDLDAKVARAQGWKELPRTVADPDLWWLPPGETDPVNATETIPSVTTSWDAFGAAFRWCAERGLAPSISGAINGYGAWLLPNIEAEAKDPRIALALAIAAWDEGRAK